MARGIDGRSLGGTRFDFPSSGRGQFDRLEWRARDAVHDVYRSTCREFRRCWCLYDLFNLSVDVCKACSVDAHAARVYGVCVLNVLKMDAMRCFDMDRPLHASS